MDPDEDASPISDLRNATWDAERELEYDLLKDMVRDAVGVLSAMAHAERRSEAPRDDVIRRIDEQKARLAQELRGLRISDTEGSVRLRAECLEIIKGYGG
ncbi:hypothetical protein ABZ249_17845 [Nocardiopsis sp. NPDC006139]|uniref:hypothetical protein n=1 Tax=Nocardiopsis sp. NPDC006139 TaxID=3154578 RepID=UPI0033A5962D